MSSYYKNQCGRIFNAFSLTITALLLIVGCGSTRPDGPEAKALLETLNRAARPLPKGNLNEYYTLLSADCKAQLQEDISLARHLDSAGLAGLPTMQLLRVLAFKNALADVVRQNDDELAIRQWLAESGVGFPLRHADRYIYTPKPKLEKDMLDQGSTIPHVLLVSEKGTLRADILHTPEFQARRMENILAKESLANLIPQAAWLHIAPERRVNWEPL